MRLSPEFSHKQCCVVCSHCHTRYVLLFIYFYLFFGWGVGLTNIEIYKI